MSESLSFRDRQDEHKHADLDGSIDTETAAIIHQEDLWADVLARKATQAEYGEAALYVAFDLVGLGIIAAVTRGAALEAAPIAAMRASECDGAMAVAASQSEGAADASELTLRANAAPTLNDVLRRSRRAVPAL